MSGIAGIIWFDGTAAERSQIEKLTAFMASLGPDEQAHWVQGSVALGHCMLRTTPEAVEEHQPLVSEDKSLVLVWDGRLDNREDLRRDLRAAGAIVRDKSDAELALQSYAVWGDKCPEHLLGDFAFAVWDARHQRLFCTRDHMGARPISYTVNDRFFAFASRDEALCLLMSGKPRPNDELVAYCLVPEFTDFDSNQSWIKDIWALPEATSLTVSRSNQVNKKTYWALCPGEELRFTSQAECQEAFLDVFGEAVRCRMRSSGHLSAMMSGGLDSVSIIAMLRRLLPEMPGKELHTYSAISDNPENCVETQCILSLASGSGKNAHFLSVPSMTGMLNVQDLIDTAWTKTHPVDNSMLLPAMMFLAAHREGHRVMLHGMGGDLTTFVPDRYIAFLLKAGKLKEAWKACQDASRNNVYLRGTAPFKQLLWNLRAAYTPARLKPLVRRLRELTAESPLAGSLINRDFADKLRLVERMRTTRRQFALTLPDPQEWHINILTSLHGITSGLSGYNRIAGRYGLELRDPWSDRRVIDFFLRLPLEFKIPSGWTKHLVRTSFGTDLSPLVTHRLTKEHLGWNLAWRLMDETPDLVEQTLEDQLSSVESYVDVKAVRDLYVQFCTEKSFEERISVYDIMTLVLWVRRMSG